MSFATFAHEIAHHLLHRGNSVPRWLEEIEAWEYALDQFERFELPGVDDARRDAVRCLHYAAAKAEKRCSPATAQRILARYEWVFASRNTDTHVSRAYLALATKGGEQNA